MIFLQRILMNNNEGIRCLHEFCVSAFRLFSSTSQPRASCFGDMFRAQNLLKTEKCFKNIPHTWISFNDYITVQLILPPATSNILHDASFFIRPATRSNATTASCSLRLSLAWMYVRAEAASLSLEFVSSPYRYSIPFSRIAKGIRKKRRKLPSREMLLFLHLFNPKF